MGALPDYVDDPVSTPTTLHEPGRYRCRCVYAHPNGAALWQSIDGAGSVWIAREEGVNVIVGTEAYISIRAHLRPLLWIFPKPADPGPATLPEGYERSPIPKPRRPAAERPPF